MQWPNLRAKRVAKVTSLARSAGGVVKIMRFVTCVEYARGDVWPIYGSTSRHRASCVAKVTIITLRTGRVVKILRLVILVLHGALLLVPVLSCTGSMLMYGCLFAS